MTKFFIPGPSGRLEALLWEGAAGASPRAAAAPRAAAIVCHPHPLGGGTMDNNVVFRTARGLQRAGLAVLRFNFRGVGASEGVHHGGGGPGSEEDDARAALDWLAARHPGLPLWGAGFSFGARTVASLSRREPRLARVLCITMPCLKFDCSFLREVKVPTHLITAGRDEYGNLAALREKLGSLPELVESEEIPEVDHFFRGKTPELEARVLAWAQSVFVQAP